MDITIIEGNINHLDDCEEALVKSELGKRYFSEKGSARKSLEENLVKMKYMLQLTIIIVRDFYG